MHNNNSFIVHLDPIIIFNNNKPISIRYDKSLLFRIVVINDSMFIDVVQETKETILYRCID